MRCSKLPISCLNLLDVSLKYGFVLVILFCHLGLSGFLSTSIREFPLAELDYFGRLEVMVRKPQSKRELLSFPLGFMVFSIANTDHLHGSCGL